MKRWLMIALMLMMAGLCACAQAEDIPEGYAIVYFQDGSRVMLPAELAGDPQQLSEYCAAYFPGRAYSFDASAGDYDALLSAEWTTAQYGEGSMAVGVRLEKLGLYTADVTLQGETVTVPTRYLTFGANEDGDRRIGVVYAPRTGEASLRSKASGSGALLETCKTGRIVAVLEYDGGTFTKILYDGEEGYIRTDCLIFHSGEQAPMGTGTIHIKGATDGNKTVTVRAEDSTSKAKVITLATGTVVNVCEKQDDWYVVESDGWYGYVQEQYLTMNEE